MTPIYIIDYLGSPIAGDEAVPPLSAVCLLDAVDVERFEGLLAERLCLDECDTKGDTDIVDEWLVIDCSEPGCREYTIADIQPADPVHDEPSLRTVLAGRGWTADGEGLDRCPGHLG